MSSRRLRQKGRIEPTGKISSLKPKELATHLPLQDPPSTHFQDFDQTTGASSPFLSSTINMPQWPKRLFQTIRPLMTRGTDADRSDLDVQVSQDLESSFRTRIPRRTEQWDLNLGGGPTKRTIGNRQSQRLREESGTDTSRARRRTRQGISPAALPEAKTQYSPSPQPVCSTKDTKRALFACPFYKLDPEMYRDCRRFELSRPKDVKQHLQRKHSRPNYCNRCYKTFSSQESLADHQRADSPCERRDGPPPPGTISEQQWEKLNLQYQSRGKPPEEQWRDFWRILFPNRDFPRSVYLHDELGEMIERMLTFWSINKEDITGSTFWQPGANFVWDNLEDRDRFVHLLGQFLEDFFWQFQAEIGSASGGAATQLDSMDGTPCIGNLTREDAINEPPTGGAGSSCYSVYKTPSVHNPTLVYAASEASTADAETSYHSIYGTPSDHNSTWDDLASMASMVDAETPRNNDIDETPYGDSATWEDTASLTSTVVGDPPFMIVSDTLPTNGGHQLRGDLWVSEQVLGPSSPCLSASLSSMSLPDYSTTDRALFGQTAGTSYAGYWANSGHEMSAQMQIEDPMVVDSQPAALPQYRWTWPGTSTETNY